jgi:hypothetical protein
MKTVFYALLAILALTLPAEAVERRIALVVGNANYQTGSLPTPANPGVGDSRDSLAVSLSHGMRQ